MLGVEQRCENAAGIKIRKAEPVDRAIGRDERRSSPVTDYGVIANRGIAVSPIFRGAIGDGLTPCLLARDAFGDQGAEALVILVAGRAAVKVIAQARKPRIGVDAGQFELDVLVE